MKRMGAYEVGRRDAAAEILEMILAQPHGQWPVLLRRDLVDRIKRGWLTRDGLPEPPPMPDAEHVPLPFEGPLTGLADPDPHPITKRMIDTQYKERP